MRSVESIIRTFRRTTVALGCVVALGACTTWRETPIPAPAALHELTGPVHVIRNNTFSLVLRDAYVKGDTLYGYSGRTRMAVALRDVQAIRRQKSEPLQTIGAVVGVTAAALVTLVVVALYTVDWSGT